MLIFFQVKSKLVHNSFNCLIVGQVSLHLMFSTLFVFLTSSKLHTKSNNNTRTSQSFYLLKVKICMFYFCNLLGANYALETLSHLEYDVLGTDWCIDPADAVTLTGNYS